MAEASDLKKVVILGLGYAGTAAARELDDSPLAGKSFEVIGIDQHNAFWHSLSAARSTVNAAFAEKAVMPFDKLITHGKVVSGSKATDITATEVVLASGERVAYDYLLISTGSSYASFIKRSVSTEATVEAMRSIREAAAVAGAKVTIVGGGLIGVEFAGEIKNAFPEAEVTIVDANEKIFSSYDWPEKARRDVMNKLTHLGVKCVFNERIVFAEDDDRELVKKRTVQLASGATLESDVQIITTGSMKPNSEVLLQSFLSGVVNEEGCIKVNEFLQVEGNEKVFAVGDISNIPAFAAANQATMEASAAVKNIMAHIDGKPLKKYTPMMGQKFAMVTVTPTTGTGVEIPFKGWTVSGWLGNKLASMKGKSMFIEKNIQVMRL